MTQDAALFFRKNLFRWAAGIQRPMPWKGESDPYRIWLSEVILQQTRVEQGWAYYERFTALFPTVTDLANAPESLVLKTWEGLGYYSRARNLHASSQRIRDDFGGRFPENYADIRSLKGVGDYTAAAIASFAYQLPYAVLDGNVYRILARYFGEQLPVDAPSAKSRYQALADQLLDHSQPGAFNQAMMDFGALQCVPQKPDCAVCPMQGSCQAFLQKKVTELPVKSKKTAKKQRLFLYAVLRYQDQVYVRRRHSDDIWKGLFEFPALEPERLPITGEEAANLCRTHFFSEKQSVQVENGPYSDIFRQILTHRVVSAAFCTLYLQDEIPSEYLRSGLLKDCVPVSISALEQEVAFPKIIASNLSSILNVSFFKLF
jgi:A/G-specific adenine glycosylase